jgi:putative Mg2+ transporter-C (MgtC) family protein
MDATSNLFGFPSILELARVAVRLLAAAILGGILGFERERKGKAAGLRTHMLVALGTALLTIAPQQAGMSIGDLSRVLQGIATGVGFIGAGTILKLTDQEQIKGLTSAATIWLTAGIGIAVGLGSLWMPVLAAIFALAILAALGILESKIDTDRPS